MSMFPPTPSAEQAWSNGRLRTVKHRVQCKEANLRYSIAAFLLGPKETIEAPAELVDAAHPRDNDPLCPVSGLQEIEKNLGEGSKVVIYKGRGHGFAHHPESAEEDADADEAFTVMRNWLYNGLVLVQ